MAQYYQIVGQGHSLTLEDLQRYCPNISLDGIILNQDGQQYAQQQVVVQQAEPSNDIIVSEGVQSQLVVSDGLQYQQQYIIRHEPPQPPPPPPRQDFQQQNQQQHHQQQQLQHRQVYYTSDLPVDAQVVLQQAQQIIDASMMQQQQQQSSPQRPQHQLVSPAHVISQPTVIHPAQQPPPQPPPSTPAQQHATQHVQHVQQQHTPQQHAPQQHTQQTLILQSQPQQQMSRASPQLIQHLQQQHQQQQIHLQLQQQQHQLQHQLQQQHQQVQHMSPQQLNMNQQHQQVVMHAAYLNQGGTPNRPSPQRLLNPTLNPAPIQVQANQVTLVRSGPSVRTVRPRRPAARAALPTTPRLLNPLIATASPPPPPPPLPPPVRLTSVARATPRVLNATLTPPPGPPAPQRVPRPRTPMHPQQMQHQISQQQLTQQQHPQQQPQQQHPQQQHPQQQHPQQPHPQQQHPQQQHPQQQHPQQQHPQQQHPQQQQHQLTQHGMGQHQMNQLQQPINQLKLSTHSLINQQNSIQQSTRIITPQGTIVTHNQANHQMPQQNNTPQSNGPMPQQSALPTIQQRASPHPQQVQQVKKVVVQTNAGDMDDLEESITAAIVQKHQPADGMAPQQYHSPSPAMRPNHATTSQGLTFNTQHYQMTYDQQHIQHPQTLTQMLLDPDPDDERQVVTLNTGQRITMADYKRLQQTPRTQQQQQQARESGRQTQIVRNKEQPRPVQRVPPMQTQPQAPQIENPEVPAQGSLEQAAETQSAKMLIFLQNGEQRLITFTLPKESCTLQEVLEQVNVPFSDDTHIQCMQNTSSEIDYFVSVGSTTRIEEMLENHPMLVGDISSRSSPSVMSQPQSSEMSTPEKQISSDTVNNGPESPGQRSPPPRRVDGMLAVCKLCGYTGYDFSRCERCKRVFTEEPKGVPIASKKAEQKKKEPERIVIEKPTPHSDGIKLNLLKTTMKTVSTKAPSEKKNPRVRKPRGKPEPEPVILTLSSDEEDSNSSMSNQYEPSVNTKEPSMSEIEGNLDIGLRMDMDEGSQDEVNPSSLQGCVISLNCRTIRIGSYRYTPKEKVLISAKGIKIVAPSLTNESRDVALQIKLKEVVRILIHFGKGLPVIFLYTMSRTGQYIRTFLDMVEDTGPFYDPMSKVDPFKRITLLPEIITEESKTVFKSLFGKLMDELNSREANEILVRTCPKEINNGSKMTTRSCSVSSGSGAKSSNPAEIRQILIYPPGKGGIPINTEDYMCLAQDQFLNDVIIDFYLKYLVHDVLTFNQRERTHIFSTFFYKRLTTKPSKVNKSSNPHEWDSALTPAQKRHARVKTWTKNVNIFEKDYIVVPINENCHWFVAIICFPSLEGCRSMVDNRTVTPQEIKKRERRSSMLIGNTTITPMSKQDQLTLSCDSDNLSERDEAEADESDLDMQCDSDEEEEKVETKVEISANAKKSEPIKQPCILIFDSLAGASRSRVVATLRDYLTCEYQAKVSPAKIFNKDNIKGSCPKIPQQNNFTDCGLYLLQYVEQFFKDPVMDYAIPIKQLVNWFDEIVVTRKREEISNLLKTLMHKFNPDSHLALPDITFPTLNGKLIEPEEANDDSESEKSCSSKSKLDNKESDGSTLLLRQMPIGDIVVKRNADNTETIHLRKTIRLTGDVGESRSMLQIKQELFKKSDSENQILIPIKMHTSELVKDIQNSLVNKNKTLGEKKHSLHNQNTSNLSSGIRQNIGENDSSSFLKGRRVTKLDDVLNESSKKFKRNEC